MFLRETRQRCVFLSGAQTSCQSRMRDAYSPDHRGGRMREDDKHDPVAHARRKFLRQTAALTGGALAAGGTARAAPLQVEQSGKEPGRVIEETAYGMPSKFEAHVKRRRTDILKNRQNF